MSKKVNVYFHTSFEYSNIVLHWKWTHLLTLNKCKYRCCMKNVFSFYKCEFNDPQPPPPPVRVTFWLEWRNWGQISMQPNHQDIGKLMKHKKDSTWQIWTELAVPLLCHQRPLGRRRTDSWDPGRRATGAPLSWRPCPHSGNTDRHLL